jgi:hypothetical protein
MPIQSVRRSSSRSIGRLGIEIAVSTSITGVIATFCQNIHCQWPPSEYQPSIALPIFCEKTKRKAYAAMPHIHHFGARLRNTKPSAAGMKAPTARPRTNCSTISAS